MIALKVASQVTEWYAQVAGRLGRNPFPPSGPLNVDPRQYWARRVLSLRHLRGNGVEIGALHQPLPLYFKARARYVDRMSAIDLRHHYPELRDLPIVDPDIVDDGEKLGSIEDGSLDFLIANHFYEHCENPIGTFRTHLGKLKEGGKLFFAIPDKTNTFDRHRPITPIEHLVRDFEQGPEGSRRAHYLEWAEHVAGAGGAEAIGQEADRLMAESYSIHFHVWDGPAFRAFLEHLRTELRFPIVIEAMASWRYNPFEVVFVVRKTAG
jgi:SAM-dependent methyltransferase